VVGPHHDQHRPHARAGAGTRHRSRGPGRAGTARSAGDTQAEHGAEPDAQPAHDDDDLAPLLERPR
jgi:hypothetical protein